MREHRKNEKAALKRARRAEKSDETETPHEVAPGFPADPAPGFPADSDEQDATTPTEASAASNPRAPHSPTKPVGKSAP